MPIKDLMARAAYMARWSAAQHAARREALAIDKFWKGCCVCGIKDSRVLDYHHTDPTTKLFSVSREAGSRSWKVLQAEVDKCVVICANHHRILEHELRNLPDEREQA